jgi:heme exporter protein C
LQDAAVPDLETTRKDTMSGRQFAILTAITGTLFAYAPVMIANAPFESTMLLVQKIFYFHVPSWFVMFTGAIMCGIASGVYLFKGSQRADHYALTGAELAVVFGMIGLITGPIWARKAWGVWWDWDVKLTLALIVWLTFVAYLLVRRYGGPGAEKLAAGLGLFGAVNIPFVYYSVNWWRSIHPKTSVVPTLGPGMRQAFWYCVLSFMLLMVLIVRLRVGLEQQRARLDELYLDLED